MAENLIEMELQEIQIVQDFVGPQVIVLGEKHGDRAFPIYIGLHEAMALDYAAQQKITPRPLTHDLILNVIDGANAQLTRVLVVKLENDTFYGALEIQLPGGELVRIDARPSDAIVVGTKRQVPMFVDEQVLREVHRSADESVQGLISDKEIEKLLSDQAAEDDEEEEEEE